VSAGTSTPPPDPAGPVGPLLPTVRFEVVDPADTAAVAWLCELLAAGRADLYGQDEADLALLPTLTRTWMRRDHQWKVKAPGTNEKRSVSTAIDLGVGALLWRTDAKRCADQFCATVEAGASRSTAQGRLAVFLTDNAQGHRVGKTGIVRRALDRLAGRVVLVFLPAYSPDLQPAERLWRQWRPNVTHNHTRATMEALQEDSDRWLGQMAAAPHAVLRALSVDKRRPTRLAA
jgi:DDE superfamily endonuclease